jgi:hypothetical protein
MKVEAEEEAEAKWGLLPPFFFPSALILHPSSLPRGLGREAR